MGVLFLDSFNIFSVMHLVSWDGKNLRHAAGIWHEPAGDVWLPGTAPSKGPTPGTDSLEVPAIRTV